MSGHVPTMIKLSALERLGCRMFRAYVAFDDQPFGERMAGRIEFVSVESNVDFYTTKLDKNAK